MQNHQYQQLFCIPESKLEYILVAHALSRCDTTSGFFGIGKCKLFKSRILEDNLQLACMFLNTDSSPAASKQVRPS